MCRVATIRVENLERYPSIWIDKEEIAELKTALQDEVKEMDQRAAAEKKRHPAPYYGGWIHPASP